MPRLYRKMESRPGHKLQKQPLPTFWVALPTDRAALASPAISDSPESEIAMTAYRLLNARVLAATATGGLHDNREEGG